MPHGTADPTSAERAPYGTIRMDGIPFPVDVGIGLANLAAFDRKFTEGDPQQDDDPLLSVWSQTDWSGGGQRRTLRSGTDAGRFHDGDLWTRDPNILTLGRRVRSFAVAAATANVWPLGDLNGVMWLSGDRAVRRWNESTLSVSGTTVATLSEHPVNVAVEFSPAAGSATELWIPHGTPGYSRFTGAAATFVAASATQPQAVAFAEWDDQLWALGLDGRLWVWDGVGFEEHARLNARHTPRALVVYYNRLDEPTLHVVTSRGLFAYDAAVRHFYPATVPGSPHPDHGRAAEVWQVGGSLFYSVGMGVRRYELGGTDMPVGLDRDSGVPAEFRGRVVDLRAATNELWALVEGATSSGGASEAEADAPLAATGVFAPLSAVSSVWQFTGAGWHRAWGSDGAGAVPTRLVVSAAEGAYRVWWGADAAYTIALPTDAHNPETGLEAGIDEFADDEQFVTTGFYNAGIDGGDKLASHVALKVRRATATEWIAVDYRTGPDEPFRQLGDRIEAPGKRVLGFDLDGDGFDEGLAWEEIEFRYRAARGATATTAPLVRGITFHFLKLPHASEAIGLSIPLYDAEAFHWWSAEHGAWTIDTLRDEIDRLLVKPGFVLLTIGERNYRVRISQRRGNRETGESERGVVNLSIVEIRVEHDEPEAA